MNDTRAENHSNWKGGRFITPAGYIRVYLHTDDPFYPMCNKKHYILEHRLVMAKHLGRLLEPWEQPHHKDLDHSNNSIDNLELKIKGSRPLGIKGNHGAGTTAPYNLKTDLEETKTKLASAEAEILLLKRLLAKNNGHNKKLSKLIKAQGALL
jgi:hypothetical protein